jgi:hypothetical protein
MTERARLDADRSAKPKTRLLARERIPVTDRAHCRTLPPANTYEAEDGSRIDLEPPRLSEDMKGWARCIEYLALHYGDPFSWTYDETDGGHVFRNANYSDQGITYVGIPVQDDDFEAATSDA